jgi:Glycosyltransferase family 87
VRLDVERVFRLGAVAVLIGIGLATALRSVQAMLGLGLIPDHPDLDAYLGAAMRLREGGELYPALPAGVSQEATFLYRYAPWFAYAFVPLTYIPRNIVAPVWDLVLVAATIGVVWPALRTRTIEGLAVGVFLGGLLMQATAFANVHALMLLPLVYRLEKRDGPLWIAVAASLKAFPLLLVLVYAGRHEWSKVAWTLGLTALLVGPMLLFDLSHYPTESAEPWLTLTNPPILYVAVVGGLAVATWRYARTRWAWLLGATLMILASPRIHQPYLAGLMVANNDRVDDGRDMSASEQERR